MTDSPKPTPAAWQPLTPRGILAFAKASAGRLLLVQFIFALAAAAMLVWFLRTAWFPTISEAIHNLPADATGGIASGKFDWPADSPQLLAEGHFLAFVVDMNHSGKLRSPAQIQVEFGRDDIFLYSLTGYRAVPYQPEWNVSFDRMILQPWWGAWAPPVLWLAFAGMIAWCLVSWWVLATIYFFPVWLAGFFANRDLNLAGSWKLAGAALMPGALVMILAILLYGLGVLDLVQLAAAVGAHVIATWVYLIWCVWISPKAVAGSAPSENPFANKAT